MEAIAAGNLVETFEKSWEQQQEVLRTEAGGFLNEAQMTALQEQQEQFKEMQLMGLKMAEKIMPGKNGEGN
jgi:vacuolar-type H+-ATPase subunit H